MAQATASFPSIGAAESLVRTFDFSAALATEETLTGTPTCTISVLSGVDATPDSRLLEGPAIVESTVTVLIGDMLPGVVYQVLVVVSTSGGQTFDLWALQPCVAP